MTQRMNIWPAVYMMFQKPCESQIILHCLLCRKKTNFWMYVDWYLLNYSTQGKTFNSKNNMTGSLTMACLKTTGHGGRLLIWFLKFWRFWSSKSQLTSRFPRKKSKDQFDNFLSGCVTPFEGI